MTRDEMIDAVIPALGLSYVRHPGYAQKRAMRVLDAVEPLIRADERERTNTVGGHRRIRDEGRADMMTDLRAKVEALAGVHDIWLYRADVLALLDGDDTHTP
jgi:hypothetical protein